MFQILLPICGSILLAQECITLYKYAIVSGATSTCKLSKQRQLGRPVARMLNRIAFLSVVQWTSILQLCKKLAWESKYACFSGSIQHLFMLNHIAFLYNFFPGSDYNYHKMLFCCCVRIGTSFIGNRGSWGRYTSSNRISLKIELKFLRLLWGK